jgi:disulfide bond formation protein DsbB
MPAFRESVLILLAAALFALGAVFIAQFGFGLAPCPLCIYQRIPYGVIVALAGAGLLLNLPPRAAKALLWLCALVFLAGAGIALFHVGVEQKWWEGLASCVASGPTPGSIEALQAALAGPIKIARCDEIAWSMFGISMAGYNLLASAALAVFTALCAKKAAA